MKGTLLGSEVNLLLFRLIRYNKPTKLTLREFGDYTLRYGHIESHASKNGYRSRKLLAWVYTLKGV